MKKFMSAVFLGLFFLGLRPLSAEVIVAVPGIVVHEQHHHHHRHYYHHYHHRDHDGGPALIMHN